MILKLNLDDGLIKKYFAMLQDVEIDEVEIGEYELNSLAELIENSIEVIL